MIFQAKRLILLSFFLFSCDSTPGEINDTTEVANRCADDELIKACPVGTAPNLMADTKAVCSADGSVDLEQNTGIDISGDVSNICVGSGSCKVVCELFTPCPNGVKTITKDAIECATASAVVCGNQVCETSETMTSCPQDCAGECENGKERCNGNDRQICTPALKWELLKCPDQQACRADEQNRDQTICVDVMP